MYMAFQNFQRSREKRLSKSLGVVQLMDRQAIEYNQIIFRE